LQGRAITRNALADSPTGTGLGLKPSPALDARITAIDFEKSHSLNSAAG